MAVPTGTTPEGPARVTVVIAARNAAGTIEACLRSIAAAHPGTAIVVADDGSTDQTAQVARRLGARVVEASGAGPSAARNQGVGAASSPLVAFTDADCTVEPGWLDALVEALDGEGVAAAGGRQINAVGGRVTSPPAIVLGALFRLAALVSDYTRSSGPRRDVPHNASCNSLYRRSVFLDAGGFRVGLWPGEDVDLDRRIRRRGYRLAYAPGAVVIHHRPADPGWLSAMMRRYGRAQGQLVRIHGPFRLLHAVPAAVLAAFAAQAGWLVPAARPALAAAWSACILTGLVALSRVAPLRLWPAIVRLGIVAALQWHRGFLDGLVQPSGP